MLLKHRQEIVLFRKAKPYLVIGCILTLTMISLDLLTSESDLFSMIFPTENVRYMIRLFGVIEDSIKLLALTFFSASVGKCLSIAKHQEFKPYS